jgi:hypothetical protein
MTILKWRLIAYLFLALILSSCLGDQPGWQPRPDLVPEIHIILPEEPDQVSLFVYKPIRDTRLGHSPMILASKNLART